MLTLSFDTHGHELFYTNKREPLFSTLMEEAIAGAKQLFLRTVKIYNLFLFTHQKNRYAFSDCVPAKKVQLFTY